MAKGQVRSTKEKRKPKQDKSKGKAAAAPVRFGSAQGSTSASGSAAKKG